MNPLLKLFLLISSLSFIFGEENYSCNFSKIRLSELVRYLGKALSVNFIADEKNLDFDVIFISQSGSSSEDVLDDLFTLLGEYNLEAVKKGESYLIKKIPEKKEVKKVEPAAEFDLYKLKYHSGEEILHHLKNSIDGLNTNHVTDAELIHTIKTLQWVKASNSLFFSASKQTSISLKELIEKLDTPPKQVYVEVLVIETDINKGHQFGVSWKNSPSKDILSACKNSLNQGINMGIIGDAIINGKQIFHEITSFAQYIQSDTDTSIILNQKILARENKLSTIFEGDSVPFAGSIIELTGVNQRTTSNIEYKDIGVMLNIIPMISDTGIITLSIDEKITESHDHLIDGSTNLSGIKTSKTQMTTEAHVPNNHFLVLSGMSRKVKTTKKSGVPLLKSIPWIGALFSSEKEVELKKNLIIFVRPSIIDEAIQLK
jgi:type III secretion protein C